MAVAFDVTEAAYPEFASSALLGAGVLTDLLPFVGDDLITEIEALSTGTGGDFNRMLAELVQAVRELRGGV